MQPSVAEVLDDIVLSEEFPFNTDEYPVLSREQEVDIFRRYAETGKRDRGIREQIYHHNRGLVLKIAGKYVGRGLDFEDLVQEGEIGILFAIDAFSLDRGTKFSTLATLVVHQTISKAITNTGRWTRIPPDILTMMSKMIGTEKEYKKKHGHFPDYNTLFNLMGWSITTFRTVFYARKVATISRFEELLDRLISGGEKREDLQLEDILELTTDETQVGFTALLEIQRIHAKVSEVTDLVRGYYDVRNAELYLRYYGFHDFSFVRADLDSLCAEFCITKTQFENIRVKCNKFIRKNIPDFVLSDLSEERCLALRELAMTFD